MKISSSLTPPNIQLDRTSKVPLQRQLFTFLRNAIADGTLKAGTRLPSSRQLATQLAVARNCVVNAYRFLAAQGLIESRRGAGTRVSAGVQSRLRLPPSTRRLPARRSVRLQRITVDVSSGTPGAFNPGVPAIDLFPLRTWRALLSRRWRSVTPAMLAYEAHDGYAPLREVIAAHLGVTRGLRCDPDQVLVVSSSQQAIDLTARVLLEPGDAACVENPGYSGARAAFTASAANLVLVPMNDEGFDVAAARRLCPHPRLIYVTPAHQYPLGVVMSRERRMALLEWANETGAWIVEDDYGGEFQYERHHSTPLHRLDTSSVVIYIGTFSQSLAPALRIGFLVAPHDVIPAFAAARAIAGRVTTTVDQAALADFITEGHLARHLRKLFAAYHERQQTLVAALRSSTPEVVRVTGTAAGTHLVAHLRDSVDDELASKLASNSGVAAPTLRSYAAGTSCPPALVLGYGSTDVRAIHSAVTVLRKAIRGARR